MAKTHIQAILLVIVVLAVVSGCTFGWEGPQARQTLPPSVESSSPSPSPSSAAAEHAPESTTALASDLGLAIQRLEDQVSLLRGLRPVTEIPIQVLPPDRLRAKALERCMAQVSGEALMPETLALLGLLRSDVDLESFYKAVAAEWAAGLTSHYDEQLQMIALAEPPALDPSSRLAYISAYLSALRAERLEGGESGCCPIACTSTGDAGLAITALFEGDARLTQEQWVRIYGSQEDAARFESLNDPVREYSLSRAPRFLQDTYDFVLSGGRAFVHGLYLSGGWPAVDQAYADPPSSTEQILHPERYPEDDPLPMQAPDLREALGPTWEPRQASGLGEWWMRQMLQAYLPPDEAAEASADWGGDVLVVYHNTSLDKDLLILISRWDNLRQAQDFALAFRKYGEARFGERRPTERGDTWIWEVGYSLLERASDQTLWILAPDHATAEAARAGLVFPMPNR